jgi:arsenate reductase (thioredoxin)
MAARGLGARHGGEPGDACPIFPGKRYEQWVLDDPAGRDVAAVRPVRDEIERRVHTLLSELELSVIDRP